MSDPVGAWEQRGHGPGTRADVHRREGVPTARAWTRDVNRNGWVGEAEDGPFSPSHRPWKESSGTRPQESWTP